MGIIDDNKLVQLCRKSVLLESKTILLGTILQKPTDKPFGKSTLFMLTVHGWVAVKHTGYTRGVPQYIPIGGTFLKQLDTSLMQLELEGITGTKLKSQIQFLALRDGTRFQATSGSIYAKNGVLLVNVAAQEFANYIYIDIEAIEIMEND